MPWRYQPNDSLGQHSTPSLHIKPSNSSSTRPDNNTNILLQLSSVSSKVANGDREQSAESRAETNSIQKNKKDSLRVVSSGSARVAVRDFRRRDARSRERRGLAAADDDDGDDGEEEAAENGEIELGAIALESPWNLRPL